MPAIKFGTGAYRRTKGGLPEFTLVNMFMEATPSAENGVALMSRQGLEENAEVGSGPIRGLFSQDGIFGGDLFTVSGGNLYRAGALLSAIVGSGPVSFAAIANYVVGTTEVLVSAGGPLYSYNGTNTVAVTFPDSMNVIAVVAMAQRFIAIPEDSQSFYFSATDDGRTWDALDFASAETVPDTILDAKVMRGNLYLLGSATIEPWYYTANLLLPFALIQQRLFPKGVHSTGCALEMDNALIFIGSDRMVYRTADVPERLSDHGIEERISQSSTASLFGFIYEGHSHAAVRLDDTTLAFDFATGQWWEMQSHQRANFAGRCSAMQGQTVLFGDDTTGKAWTFSDGYSDDGEELLREWTGAFPIKGGTVIVDNMTVDANSGRTTLLAGQGSDPAIEMASSRDAGASWSAFRSARLGAQGEYRARPRWTRLGMFDAPGAMFKCRVTDAVDVRVSNMLINEDGGGQSRA